MTEVVPIAEDKTLKTKDYILRAKKNYYHKKKETDPEFKEKTNKRINEWRDKNRDKINEQARLRRLKKKQEQEALKALEKLNIETHTPEHNTPPADNTPADNTNQEIITEAKSD